jgi:putative ABC transport system permease protein
MLLVARKNLFAERTRLAISVGGVALSVLLIMLLLALYRGWDEKVGGFVEDSSVDVWIASEGAKDFLAAASLLPIDDPQQGQAVRDVLDNDPDIEEWSPLIVRQMEGVKVDIKDDGGEEIGKEMNLQFIGFDTETGLGGPLSIKEGRGDPGDSEVVVDEALSKRYGVGVDDIVRAGGKDWTVVGVSEGGDFVATQTVFVNHEEARQALSMDDQTTFVVLKLTDGTDLSQWREDFIREQGPLVTSRIVLYSSDEFATNTRDRILSNVIPILLMVLALAFIVGLAVAGLTIYTATVEKQREYGILKAVGFKNSFLYRVVLEQSLVTGILGFLIGVGITILITLFASDFVPQFVTYVRLADIAFVALVTLIMSAIAAYIPVRRLASIDPVAVFKA